MESAVVKPECNGDYWKNNCESEMKIRPKDF